MARLIGGTLVGYVVYFALVFLLMTAAWAVLGVGAFKPGVWEVTGLWIGLMLLASFLAALIAGLGSARFMKDARGPAALAGLIILFGILFAWPVLTGTMPVPPLPRPDTLPMSEAMEKGQAPLWVALVNPTLGALGALLGARLVRPV